MDKYGIDHHKLIYHVRRVNGWLNGETTYPVYVEMSPAGACNHRCTFCAVDFMKYRKRYLDYAVLEKRIPEMARLGVKSIMYAGEGEPLLHDRMGEIVELTSGAGIDVALTTNGVLLEEPLARRIMGRMEWIKVSINAGTPETYAAVHRTRASDFRRVLDNIEAAVRIKREKGYGCTVGMQMLLLPENMAEAPLLAEKARAIGADYLVIKPYSHHKSSKTDRYSGITYEGCKDLSRSLAKCATPDFNVIFRTEAMKTWDRGDEVTECLALPFWAYVDAGGNLWGCSAHLGNEKFRYGNLNEEGFEEIWAGPKRAGAERDAACGTGLDACRVNCRMAKINRYLTALKTPPPHVNFI